MSAHALGESREVECVRTNRAEHRELTLLTRRATVAFTGLCPVAGGKPNQERDKPWMSFFCPSVSKHWKKAAISQPLRTSRGWWLKGGRVLIADFGLQGMMIPPRGRIDRMRAIG